MSPSASLPQPAPAPDAADAAGTIAHRRPGPRSRLRPARQRHRPGNHHGPRWQGHPASRREPSLSNPGQYETPAYVPRQRRPLPRQATVSAPDGSDLGQITTGWASDPAAEEFRVLQPNRALLERIAAATGGQVIAAGALSRFRRRPPRPPRPDHRALCSAVLASILGFPHRHRLPRRRVGPAAMEGAAMTHPRSTLAILLIAIFACTARAADPPSPPRPTVIVVIGAPGTPEYGADFAKSADAWADACKRAAVNYIEIGRDSPRRLHRHSRQNRPATLPGNPRRPSQ